eukprot:12022929-Prorocentrum_lima.AAC.2
MCIRDSLLERCRTIRPFGGRGILRRRPNPAKQAWHARLRGRLAAPISPLLGATGHRCIF